MGPNCSTGHPQDNQVPVQQGELVSSAPPVFPLLDLPQEVLLSIVAAVDQRDSSPTFPEGPSEDLLALSRVNRWFHKVSFPRVWRSVRWTNPGRLRPARYLAARSLVAFKAILEARTDPFPIQEFSVEDPTGEFGSAEEEDEDERETAALVQIIKRLAASGLQVLFLKEVLLSKQEANDLMEAIFTAPRLSALRFNQVSHSGTLRSFDEVAPLVHIRTCQIMHGSSSLLNLVPKCPNLDSLLLWPSSRRLGVHANTIKALLPRLRLLSMDSVREGTAFRTIADEILRLSSLPYADPLPLEELFLEGPMTVSDRAVLLSSLARLPSLRRLALYQYRSPKPALLSELAAVAPQLHSLTIVSGDCEQSVEWPAPVDEYLPYLSKFAHLRFFAWDRKSPQPYDLSSSTSPTSPQARIPQARLEFETMAKLARACPSLEEAVVITKDYSEGSQGFFASFTKEKGKIRIALKSKTVNDFLIAYDRWVRVEED
ncbi:hypothetical protein JCM1840_004989 [Sporobolomyces johnsonii]